jgi:hypothetical protein
MRPGALTNTHVQRPKGGSQHAQTRVAFNVREEGPPIYTALKVPQLHGLLQHKGAVLQHSLFRAGGHSTLPGVDGGSKRIERTLHDAAMPVDQMLKQLPPAPGG